MSAKNICFKFLVENKTDNPGVCGEHGLSIYIEADGKNILFDAGATDMIINNAKKMKANLSDVDFAVISHGHYDHTGGFPAFCSQNNKAPIYVHKNAFRLSYGMEKGVLDKEHCGIMWTKDEKKSIEQRLVYTDKAVYPTENICITGTVDYADECNITEKFYYKDDDGKLIEDDMSHEQCLVIKQETGLYIFSGCSHRGVLSAIEAGKKAFPGEKVAVLVAGMHLYSASEKDRKNVINQIVNEMPEKVMPVHCTGINAICDLKTALGDRCVVATAGDIFYG